MKVTSNEKETRRLNGQSRMIAFAAALTTVLLRYSLGVSWLWSIAAGFGVLLVPGMHRVLRKKVASMIWQAGPTWAIGNLPPLDLKSSDPLKRRAGRSNGGGTSLSAFLREGLAVWINNTHFELGDRMDAETLAHAGFEKASSVAQVQARALDHQVLVVSKDCNVRAFGHQLNIVTMKGKDPTTSDFDLTGYVTAFLFFAPLDSERSTGRQLERIVIVLAGGHFMLNHVTANFVRFATEFFGPSEAGARGQRTWQAGDCFLVCEEEQWKEVRRTTFTWTSETLSSGGQHEN